MAIQVIPNDYYETKRVPESLPHPHPPLRDFKIMMVSKITDDRSQVVCNWPSMDSLAFFFESTSNILPAFDNECTLTEPETTSLINRHIETVDLCFFTSRLKSNWLHLQETRDLDAARGKIGLSYRRHQQRNHIMLHRLYAIDYMALPRPLRKAIGFVRVARVTGVMDDPNVEGGLVEVRTPSMGSMDRFFSSEGSQAGLPEFNRVFIFSRFCARLFLKRILPEELCVRLRIRRDFWINDYEEGFYLMLHDDASAAAGDSFGDDYALAGGDADVDDASSRVGSDDAEEIEVDGSSVGSGGGDA